MGNNVLGIKGLKGNLSAGVGFIIIPDGVDIDQYKQDVYQSGRVSIFGGYGHSNFYNILVDREVIQRIKFPSKAGEMGSPVVWLNVPKHNEPIIIACLKYDEDYFDISENRRRSTVTHEGNILDLDMDAKKGKIIISGKGMTKPMVFNIDISDKNNSAIFKVNIDGEILVRSIKRLVVVSGEKIEQAVTNKSGIVQARLIINPNEDGSVLYEDRNKNKIIADKEKIKISKEKSVFEITEKFKIENEFESFASIMKDMLKMYMSTKTIKGEPLDPSSLKKAVKLMKQINKLFD